jgi:ATP-dependent exoDNAse (exonuclease V) alpha subunit
VVRPSLSDEQRELVRALTRQGGGVEVVRAPAGTGKTFALDAAREAWQRSGIPVLGCALSARAASELRDQASIDATTIARLTYGLDHGLTLAADSVLLVDEAGMVGTRDLAGLSDAAEAADAKLVLVGDDRQLPEIEAGGLFAALGDGVGALELSEVRRQQEAWDREALAALRVGDVERFARDYHEHRRIVAAPTADHARERLVNDWLESAERGEGAVMIAHRRRDVADLNQRARERLRETGRLQPDELVTATGAFAVGDRVIVRRNDRRLGIVNGDAGQLVAIGDARLIIERDDGRHLALPKTYAQVGHLQHGYALTAHLAQGSTVDRAFVLGSDELYREWGYTALSRHRAEARFYVSATPTFLNRSAEPLQPGVDAAASVAAMLRDSRVERLALHGVAPDHVAERLEEEIRHAGQQLAEADARLVVAHHDREHLRWYDRGRRRDLDLRIQHQLRTRDHWQQRVGRLNRELKARPDVVAPSVARAIDPLESFQRAPERVRRQQRQRDIGLER